MQQLLSMEESTYRSLKNIVPYRNLRFFISKNRQVTKIFDDYTIKEGENDLSFAFSPLSL